MCVCMSIYIYTYIYIYIYIGYVYASGPPRYQKQREFRIAHGDLKGVGALANERYITWSG